MRSLSKVLKPDALIKSDEIVMIPDAPPPPPPVVINEEGEEEAFVPTETYEEALHRGESEGRRLSQKMLAHAREEREAILLQARVDGEEIRAQCRREGYESGAQSKMDEVAESIARADTLLRELSEAQSAYLRKYAAELKNFAIDIADKVLVQKLETDEKAMTELVITAIKSVKTAQWISVEVSEELPKLVRFLETEWSKRGRENTRVEFSAGRLPPGGCVLHTSEGNVDVSVSTQLANLKEYFNQLD